MAQEVTRKPYRRDEALSWITRHPRYLRYLAREFSCLFIGAWTLLMVCGLSHLAEGAESWGRFLELLRSPVSIVFHIAALVFTVYHSITWFNLTPKAMPLQLGEEFAPDAAISGAHFAGWAVLSLAVLYLAGAF